MKTEASVLTGVTASLVVALVACLAAWGVDVSDAQQSAILGLAAVLAPIIAAIVTRSKVWSQHSHEAAVEAAKERIAPKRPKRTRP